MYLCVLLSDEFAEEEDVQSFGYKRFGKHSFVFYIQSLLTKTCKPLVLQNSGVCVCVGRVGCTNLSLMTSDLTACLVCMY